MIFIQSKGQLNSKRKVFADNKCYSNNKNLTHFDDVILISGFYFLIKVIFSNQNIILGDVRSTFSYFRRIFHNNNNTQYLSDGLGTEVAKKIYNKYNRLYFSHKNLPFFKIFLDYFVKAEPIFLFSNNSNIKNPKKSNDIYFIGQALYENNIASIEDELCQINSSNADYYFPHPKDSKSKLDQIKKSIKIMYVDILVEEYLELHGFKCLIGFSSSVLFNFKESNIKLIPVKYKNNWLGKDCEIAYKILKNYI